MKKIYLISLALFSLLMAQDVKGSDQGIKEFNQGIQELTDGLSRIKLMPRDQRNEARQEIEKLNYKGKIERLRNLGLGLRGDDLNVVKKIKGAQGQYSSLIPK